MVRYYARVLVRVFWETVNLFPLTRKEVVTGIIIYAISLGFTLLAFSPEGTLKRELPTAGLWVTSVVVFVAVLLLVNFVRAPYLLDAQRQTVIDGLSIELEGVNTKLKRKGDKEESVQRLMDCYLQGWTWFCDYNEGRDLDRPGIKKWVSSTIDVVIEEVGKPLALDFTTCEIQCPDGVTYRSEGDRRMVGMLYAPLERLKEYMKRVEDS